MGHWGTCPPRPPTISSLVHFGVNLTATYCVVCDISWCRCQQLTALLISTALVTKLLVIEQSAASGPEACAPWHNHQLRQSSQQILATPLGVSMRYLSGCLSLHLSVKRVDCDRTDERSVQIFIPYERTFSLVFWEEEWFVGGDHFYVGAKSPIFNRYSLLAPQP